MGAWCEHLILYAKIKQNKVLSRTHRADFSLEGREILLFNPWGGGGGLLPYKRLMGMCRWMGSHFHDWID